MNASRKSKLTTLGIADCPHLKELYINNNTVLGPTFDISPFTGLRKFSCFGTAIETVYTYWEPGKRPETIEDYNIGDAKEVLKK